MGNFSEHETIDVCPVLCSLCINNVLQLSLIYVTESQCIKKYCENKN